MWIAAHPDDEAVVAPLLAKWCIDDHARCSFLVLTRGEAGDCLLPNGCHPDLATVRSAEAAAATQYFHADSILLTLPNESAFGLPDWRESSSGRPDVVAQVAALIEAVHPALILTFDPRHGTTCHAEHMETGAIALEAVERLSFTPDVYLLETRLSFTSEPFGIGFDRADVAAQRFDANQMLPFTGRAAWEEVTSDMDRHPSQFNAEWIAAVAATPASDRAVYIERASVALGRAVFACQ
ncbi:MAG TPA: PIG-L family deacetylase [Thermoanaerobaculia bacterium]|nr:PIG-L family deacetylase [Thermoanaerobaculia bacterium]